MPRPGQYLRLHPLLPKRCNFLGLLRQKNSPNERTDQSSKEIQLSNEEIANLSDAEFKTVVFRMLTEMVEYGTK